MVLCFGTFATVLCLYRNQQSHISQATLVAKLARCVDRKSNYMESSYRYNEEDDWNVTGDGPAISKLLHCTKNFVFSDVYPTKPALENVIKDFDKNISPFIKENKKAAIILTLLEIIRSEIVQKEAVVPTGNDDNFENYLTKTKSVLLHQTSFSFSDFLGRILYYTTFGEIDNIRGKKFVHLITEDFVNKIAGQYAGEYKWIQSSQTLSMTFVDLYSRFVQALRYYHIITFIEKTDPTVQLKFDSVEKCEEFIQEFNNLESPSQTELGAPGFTMCKIQEFVRVLDNYTIYLGLNMRPVYENAAYYVPFYRDENTVWEMWFGKKVQSYRKRLCSLYREIYNHMPFSPISLISSSPQNGHQV